jgi:hypothetical protein
MTDTTMIRRDAVRALAPAPQRRDARSAILAAARLLQDELDRLQALQLAEESRQAAARRSAGMIDDTIQAAQRKAAARQALRSSSLSVDKKWFEGFVSEVLNDLAEQATSAAETGQRLREDFLRNRIARVTKDVERVLEQDRLSRSTNHA